MSDAPESGRTDHLLYDRSPFLFYTPPGLPSIDLVRTCDKSGSLCLIDLDGLDEGTIKNTMNEIEKEELGYGVRVNPFGEALVSLISRGVPEGLRLVVSTPKDTIPEMVRRGVYDTVHDMGLKVYQEICTLEEAKESIRTGVDGIVARGSEGGGRVSSFSTLELITAVREMSGDIRLIARGGISEDSIRGISKAGADGFVLDDHPAVLKAAGVSGEALSIAKDPDPEGFMRIGEEIGRIFSLHVKDDELATELTQMLEDHDGTSGSSKRIYTSIKRIIRERAIPSYSGEYRGVLLIGTGSGKSNFPDVTDIGQLMERAGSVLGSCAEWAPPGPQKVIENGSVSEMKQERGEVTVDGGPVPQDYYDDAVAIVGIGAVFPTGIGMDEFWRSILDGKDAMTEIPPDRWDWRLHYDPDPNALDKTYSKVGAFIRDLHFDPFEFKIPPKVAKYFDRFQRYEIVAAKEALVDSGIYQKGEGDESIVGVIIANSGGGDNRDLVAIRTAIQELKVWAEETEAWKVLPSREAEMLFKELKERINEEIIDINEDTMPGALPNIASGRIANLFGFTGPNFITDAACASTFAAVSAARDALLMNRMRTAVTGGTDSAMSVQGFVEFCRIGALTPDGSRPFSKGANGFLMGEGCGIFVMKKLGDAVEDDDMIYAVIRGLGASSDGKGKGITAPNPKGQMLAIERGIEEARVDKSTITFLEAHGTSTAVGDLAELNALDRVFSGLPARSVGLTSVKSQIGHLKSAAGAAGLAKAAYAVHKKIIPPQINFSEPNPYYDWEKGPLYVITEARDWDRIRPDVPRRCGVSAFGFGGTNFHIVLEEFDRDIYSQYLRAKNEKARMKREGEERKQKVQVKRIVDERKLEEHMSRKGELEGEVFLFGSDNPMDLLKKARKAKEMVSSIVSNGGRMRDAIEKPDKEGRYRLAIVAKDAEHLEEQIATLIKTGMDEKALLMLRARGIFVGDRERVDRGKVCFMFPGQGSQYLNMFRELGEKYSIVRESFRDADRIMSDLLEKPLSSYVFVDHERGSEEFNRASEVLRQTEYNQPSMLTVDTAMYRMLKAMGVEPDLVMGHSLGEYGALIASGIFSFDDSLRAVSARGKEIKDIDFGDVGKMAAVSAGLDEVNEVICGIDGYIIPANKNCLVQTVIAGESQAVEEAVIMFKDRGVDAVLLPVSHAFHSEIVAPAKEPLREYLSKLTINPPEIPILSNVTADYYPREGSREEIKERILDLLQEQVASSVEWMSQVRRAYEDGCRVFIEAGPKRALSSFVYNILEDKVRKGEVFPLLSNHPKKGGITTFNELIGSLWSLGFDIKVHDMDDEGFYTPEFIRAFDDIVREEEVVLEPEPFKERYVSGREENEPERVGAEAPTTGGLEEFIQRNRGPLESFLADVYRNTRGNLAKNNRDDVNLERTGTTTPPGSRVNVTVTGAAFGLPGRFKKVFSEKNMDLLVEGRNLIEPIDEEYLPRFLEKNIIRLDKKPDGSAELIKLDDKTRLAHLAGMLGEFDLAKEFDVPDEVVENLDITSRLAFASGLLALKDAGIPLVRRYSITSTGSFLPENWELPMEMQEDTGIIFASAFPGYDQVFYQFSEFCADRIERAKGKERKELIDTLRRKVKGTELEDELDRIERENGDAAGDYRFPRHYIFRVLSMGHTQFAQYIKAKGPNTQVNSACSSTTIAISIAQDWIQAGRCKRVLVLGADDPSSRNNLEWFGSGMLALGALTTESDVTEAALPFDKRRKGMILGSGGVGLVVETEEEPRRRGIKPLVEILGTHIGNSAFHGSRLDIAHIARSMDLFISKMEKEWGLNRKTIAGDLLFMSHETYTPARGGSSAAEVESLRRTFGENFREILIMNTKGFTGHAYGCCIEDPAMIRSLVEGRSIPIANLTPSQIDPQFEGLNLSTGGTHDRTYGLHLAAGFGSQLAFLLVRKVSGRDERADEGRYNEWLRSIASTQPVELEIGGNVLLLRDQGRDNLIKHRAVRRGSSEIGFEVKEKVNGDKDRFEEVKDRVLRIISGKTGYPIDMLDLDADLESDLGIDTVKQVELFASARIDFNLPKDEGVNLRDYPNIRKVIEYIIENSPEKPSGKMGGSKAEVDREQGTDGSWERIRKRVISLVSEKTGYPEDMLDIDLDLEADLGIDTVKQVELFAQSRSEFDLPRDDSVNLADFSTLRHIIDYVNNMTGGDEVEGKGAGEKEEVGGTGSRWNEVRKRVVHIVAEKTGYPEDMLELDLDLEADLGIDTVKQVELFAQSRSEFDLPRDDSVNLADFSTLRHIIDYVNRMTGGDEVEEEGGGEVGGETVEGKETAGYERFRSDVSKRVLSIVADRTGYPEDMLELDLDLEADLGIDTVKQVELFAQSRSEFDLPRDDSVNLSDFPTLRHIIDYIVKLTWKETEAYQAEREGPVRDGDDKRWERVRDRVVSIVAEKTGYPEDMLDLDLDLEADLGVDTVKQVELFSMARSEFDLERDDTVNLSDLNTLRKIVDYVMERSKEPAGEQRKERPTKDELRARINRWVLTTDEVSGPGVEGANPVEGRKALVIGGSVKTRKLLEGILGIEAVGVGRGKDPLKKVPLGELDGIINVSSYFIDDDPDPKDWEKEADRTVKILFNAAKGMGDRLKDGGFLYTITRMGGRFGLDCDVNPFNGGMAGFTKAVAREYPKADVIALDLDRKTDLERAIELLSREISTDEHPLEVGYSGEKRFLTAMRIMEPTAEETVKFKDGMALLVSGGGGGITAEIVKKLATLAKFRLHLVDVAELLPDSEELSKLDDEQLERKKEEIRDNLKREEKKVTPVILEREFSRITRSVGVFNLLRELEKTGCEVHYHQADIRDRKALSKIVRENGPINGVIHAAGMERSKMMVNKTPEEFSLVYDIKVMGAKAIIDAVRDQPLSFFMGFTSVAGRFGNGGQVDYSAANDTLAKVGGAIRKYNPDCIVKALGWSAWADIGMASRGSVKTILEIGGVTFIPPKDGISYAISEVQHGREREVYYFGSLGPMDSDDVIKWEEGVHKQPEASAGTEAPLIDTFNFSEKGVVSKRELDGIREPFLPDHSIMGTMVLPGVMGMEMFAETASRAIEGLDILELKDVVFRKAVNVKEKLHVRIVGEVTGSGKGTGSVKVKLVTDDKNGREIEHFEGNVIMGKRKGELEKVRGHPLQPKNVTALISSDEIYTHFFHRERFRVLSALHVLKDGELLGISKEVHPGLLMEESGWNPSDLLIDPMRIESGFQSAGAYVLDRFKMMALPTGIGSLKLHKTFNPEERGLVWVRFKKNEGNRYLFDVDILDLEGNIRISLEDYELKALMPFDGSFKGIHNTHFEELETPIEGIRIFRVDVESLDPDIERYRELFRDTEWKRIDWTRMVEKRKKEHMAGRLVAKLGCSWVETLNTGAPVSPADVQIDVEKEGKPYAEISGIKRQISISHCRRWAVCSISDDEHGLDLELSEPRDPSFMEQAFTGDESDFIERIQKEYGLGPDEAITMLFSAKEAFLKMEGSGLADNLKKVNAKDIHRTTTTGFELILESEGKEKTVSNMMLGAYILSICSKGQ